MAMSKHFLCNEPWRKSPSCQVLEVNPSFLELSRSSGLELVIFSFITRGLPVMTFPQAMHFALGVLDLLLDAMCLWKDEVSDTLSALILSWLCWLPSGRVLP